MTLSKYTNNLFATHATMESALEYVQMMAQSSATTGSDYSLAVQTAAQVLLNTAISMHHAELAAVNRPLIELIDARVAEKIETEIQKAFTVVQSSIEQALENYDNKMDEKIESALSDFEIDDQMQGWFDSNFDIESCLSGLSIRVQFD